MSSGPAPSDDPSRDSPSLDPTFVERAAAIRQRLRKIRGQLNRQLIEVFRRRKPRPAPESGAAREAGDQN